MKNINWVIPSVAAAVAVITAGAVYLAARPQPALPRTVPLAVAAATRAADGYWKKGSERPKVVIEEYADYQCPTCAATHPVIESALAATVDIAQLRYRMYPLVQIHRNAQSAALAGEAAGRQGRFWEMSDLLYSRQAAWEGLPSSTFRAAVLEYAAELLLDRPQFEADLDDRSTAAAVAADVASGARVPVKGTPTILINGTVLDPLPRDAAELERAIRAAVPAS